MKEDDNIIFNDKILNVNESIKNNTNAHNENNDVNIDLDPFKQDNVNGRNFLINTKDDNKEANLTTMQSLRRNNKDKLVNKAISYDIDKALKDFDENENDIISE